MKKLALIILILSLRIDISYTQGSALPYNTGFDTPAQKAGWKEYRKGFSSTGSWSFNGGLSFSQPNSISHDYNVGGNQADTVIDWFVSPPLNMATKTKLSLKLFVGGFSSPLPDNLEIWYGHDNQNPSLGNFSFVANLSYMQPKGQWLDTVISIPNNSPNGYIAFKYKTIGAFWWTPNVDNISLTVDSTTSSNNSGPKDEYEIEIKPNPFSSFTTISLSENLLNYPLQMRIFNILGYEVKCIDKIENKETNWSRENLPNGLYFINLIHENKSILTKKVLIE